MGFALGIMVGDVELDVRYLGHLKLFRVIRGSMLAFVFQVAHRLGDRMVLLIVLRLLFD